MKIIYIVTRSNEIGGAQIHVRDLAKELKRQGHDVIVLAGGDGRYYRQLEAHGILFRRIPDLLQPINPIKDISAFNTLRKYICKEKPDLISLHSSKVGFLGRICAKLYGVPVVFTAHGWSFTEGIPGLTRYIYFVLEWLTAPLATRIITVSAYDRFLALRYRVGKKQKLITICNGMPDIEECFFANPADESIKIIMIARFSLQKDHVLLLKALSTLMDIEWSLELIGSGSKVSVIKSMVVEFGLEKRVHFSGEVSDIMERMSKSQIYVLTSFWEGLPRSIIEAMRAGLPVVASRVGGVAELISDGENGFLIEPGDVNTLIKRLQQLLGNPELRIRMGKAGRQRYVENFRFEQMVQKTIEVYRSCV